MADPSSSLPSSSSDMYVISSYFIAIEILCFPDFFFLFFFVRVDCGGRFLVVWCFLCQSSNFGVETCSLGFVRGGVLVGERKWGQRDEVKFGEFTFLVFLASPEAYGWLHSWDSVDHESLTSFSFFLRRFSSLVFSSDKQSISLLGVKYSFDLNAMYDYLKIWERENR